MSRPKLELVSLVKEYNGGDVKAVDNIDLAIDAVETVALLGPSGCGKSTTLNMIVGLEYPTSGDILIDGKSVVATPPGKRNVGLVFQDYAVFTSMSVRKNLAFGLTVRGRPKSEINKAVEETAELLGMKDQLDAKAKDLGGSELQRIAIGRTLVTKPEILLLDEPLSNLEAAARLAMRRELRRLQSEIGITIIYVTHDQIEALSLANRIAIMHAGRVLQVEDSKIITSKPDHTFVAGFLGSPAMNLYWGRFEREEGRPMFLPLVKNPEMNLQLEQNALPPELPQGEFIMGVRPEKVRLVPESDATLSGRVSLVEPRGPEVVLTVELGLESMKVVAPSHDYPPVNTVTGLTVDTDSLLFFSGDTHRRTDIFVQG